MIPYYNNTLILDGPQTHSLIENGDNQVMSVKTDNEEKMKTITVVVSPKTLQLPIDSCVLEVSCVPTANEQNTYTYKLSLKKDEIKHNDDNLEDPSATYDHNILQLSKFVSLTHAVYNYKLKVTSSDEKWKGEDSGVLNIYPGKL